MEGPIGGHVGHHPGGADRGQQIGQIGQHGGLAATDGDLEHAPGRQPFDDPMPDRRVGLRLAPGPALGIAERAAQVAAIRHGPVGHDRGAQARVGIAVEGRIIGQGIAGQGGASRGDAADDGMGLEIAEQADGLGRTRFVPACAEPHAQLRPGAGLVQEPGRLETRAVELEQVAGVALERETTPGLAAEPHRGMALDPGAGSRTRAHRFSNWSTIVLAARDSLRGFVFV